MNFCVLLSRKKGQTMNEVQILTAEIGEEMLLPYFPEGIRAGFPSPATDYEEEVSLSQKEREEAEEALNRKIEYNILLFCLNII